MAEEMNLKDVVVGYDFDTKFEKSPLHQCSICKFLIRGCTELDCGDTFCRECLDRWEQQQQKENEQRYFTKIYERKNLVHM